jgi:hypothetical protein
MEARGKPGRSLAAGTRMADAGAGAHSFTHSPKRLVVIKPSRSAIADSHAVRDLRNP